MGTTRSVETVETAELVLAYELSGPEDGVPVVAVHGWPDSPACWDDCLEGLHAAGCRVYRPYLRGFGPTRFPNEETMRSGQPTALASDLGDFIDALALVRPVLAGHDWGGRAGYALAALRPEVLCGLVVMSVAYEATGPNDTFSNEQARSYWYQWLFSTEVGRAHLRSDRRGLCHLLWKTWAPSWDFTDVEFETAAKSWENPDWAAVTEHSYSQRWGEAAGDPARREAEQRLAETPPISVPTLLLHGEEDGATLVESTADQDDKFDARYERRVLAGVGHFVPREAPDQAVEAILELARSHP